MLLWHIFTQVLAPILVMIGLGWLVDRRWHLNLETLVRLNMYLLSPAFIFYEVVSSKMAAELAFRVMLFTASVIASMYLLSSLVGKFGGYTREETRSLQLATMFYNSGNYGVPLMTLAFPVLGPVLQVFILLTQNISAFTVGLFLASTVAPVGWRTLLPMLRQVALWSVLAAVITRTFEIPVQTWRWLWVPAGYLHGTLVGFALATLGVQLSQTKVQPRIAHLSWALVVRLLGGPLIAYALVKVFGFTGEAAKVMILSSSFPTAVNTAMLAHEFKADSDFAATAVFYSTLGSVVTVTVLVALLS